jgi:alpha-mannosidase
MKTKARNMRSRIGPLALAGSLLFVPAASCQETKRVYIANDEHTDYMWHVGEEETRRAWLEMLDYYLDLADSTSGEAADFQSRFNPDGTLWAWTFEKNRSAAQYGRLIQRIKDGHITVPLTLLNLGYGAMPAEAVLRSMYPGGRLERRHGLRLRTATAQENQTLPYGLGALWAGAGAKYTWKGICGCASRVPDAWDRPADMYWWENPDGSRLLVKWYSQIRRDAYDVGGYAEARSLPGVIDFVDTDTAFKARVPYDVVGLFGHGGDDVKSLTDAFVGTAKTATNAGRRVVVSNIVDFFEDFERTHGAAVPAQALSFGNEWDILTASMAELSGRVKRNVEKLRSAEAMASLVVLHDGTFRRGREDERDAAWIDLGMYYEHDWTADGPIGRDARAAWQRQKASGFEAYVASLYADASAALGKLIRKDGSRTRFFVFNPLGWPRTEAADFIYDGAEAVHAVDVTTGREAPSQIVARDGERLLRVWAEDVPSLGYKVYEIAAGPPSAGGGPSAAGSTIENGFARIELAGNGAIASLVDKTRSGREFVRPIDGRRMNDLGPGDGTVEVVNAGPVSATLLVRATGPLPHATAVTLFRDSPRVEIRNEITRNFGSVESWAFSFNLDGPDVWHEEVGAVIRARLAEQGGHYASRAARYDWLSLNHFADISAGGVGVTLSSPDLSFMRLGRSEVKTLDTDTAQISVLAGGQVDGPSLGISNQGGDGLFLQRFALQAHDAFDAAAAMRFALEHQNPLAAGEVTGGTALHPATSSLLAIDDPDLLLWSVKPAEDTAEGGLALRFWNLSGGPATAAVEFVGYAVLGAERTSLVETPIEPAVFETRLFRVNAAPREWLAFRIELDGAAPAGKNIGRKKIR